MYILTFEFGLSGLGQTSSLVSAMAAAITQMEGVNPAFVGNNNPGNLVYVGTNQNGQTGVQRGAGGFAAFPTLASGQSALNNQIQAQINSGQDLTDFFNQYAPGGTTNAAGGVQTSAATQNYINFVSGQLGIDPSVSLASVQGSYSGPGSAVTSDSGNGSGSTDDSGDGSSLDLASYLPSSLASIIPGSDTTVSLAGVVLSGSDLFVLGLAAVAVLAVHAIL